MCNTSSSSQVTLLLEQSHALEVNEATDFRHNWYLQHALLHKSAMQFKGNSNASVIQTLNPCEKALATKRSLSDQSVQDRC